MFTTLTDGLGALPAAVAAASGATVRTRARVRELTRTATGWRLVVGSAADPEEIQADAVVLALPARPASRLLSGVPDGKHAPSPSKLPTMIMVEPRRILFPSNS